MASSVTRIVVGVIVAFVPLSTAFIAQLHESAVIQHNLIVEGRETLDCDEYDGPGGLHCRWN
jgi:hypothetical protein